MYYGYECKNPEHNWEGPAACWVMLTYLGKGTQVESINFCMSDSYHVGSLVDCLVKEFMEADKSLIGRDARGMAMHELCETVLRNRVQWKLELREGGDPNRGKKWWLRVENISEMPKNHLMFLLFSLRSSLHNQADHIWKALRDRGIKSNRKMIIGSQLISQVSGLKGLNYVHGVTTGGRIFLSDLTTKADVVTIYRGTNLKGPADEAWSVGGGYTSGWTGRTVQYAGCSSMKVSEKGGIARNHCILKLNAKDNMLTLLDMNEGPNYRSDRVFDNLADFLKNLK